MKWAEILKPLEASELLPALHILSPLPGYLAPDFTGASSLRLMAIRDAPPALSLSASDFALSFARRKIANFKVGRYLSCTA